VVAGQVFFMRLSFAGAGVDGDVVHVNGYTPSINEVLEDGVHHGLKCGWRVGEPEEHYCGLKEPFIGYESCLSSILLLNEDFIVPLFDIESHE
jgi:hypothetical protein